MKYFLIVACFASVLIQHQADNSHVGKQSQQNAQASQNRAVAPAPSQTSVNAAEQKPAGDADKNHSQPVSITSVPKIAVKSDEDWVMVICTIILTGVGIVGTCAAIKTLKAINRQAHYMLVHARHFDKLAKATANQSDLMNGQLVQMTTAGTHTKQLAEQAVRQSDLTQRQLDLANRPWVCLDSIVVASDFVFKDSGEAVILFQYQIRNVGHSVAQHLKPWIEPIVSGVHNPLEVKERISALQRRPVDSVFDHGKLLFPSQVIIDGYPVVIRKEIVEAAIQKSQFKEGDKQLPCFSVELFICFDYQSTLDDPTIHHQTQKHVSSRLCRAERDYQRRVLSEPKDLFEYQDVG